MKPLQGRDRAVNKDRPHSPSWSITSSSRGGQQNKQVNMQHDARQGYGREGNLSRSRDGEWQGARRSCEVGGPSRCLWAETRISKRVNHVNLGGEHPRQRQQQPWSPKGTPRLANAVGEQGCSQGVQRGVLVALPLSGQWKLLGFWTSCTQFFWKSAKCFEHDSFKIQLSLLD